MLVDTFKASLDPSLFKLYRRYLYSRYKATDELAQGEVVHEIAKERLGKLAGKFEMGQRKFAGHLAFRPLWPSSNKGTLLLICSHLG